MPLEQDIKDLVAELKISNALRREDLDFRKQLYAAAANTSSSNTITGTPAVAQLQTETPAPKKGTKAAKLEVVEPTPEPVAEEVNVPPTGEPFNPDPAPTEPYPTPVEVVDEPAEKVTINDVLDFQRGLLKDTSVDEKKAIQTKLREVLAEFGAKATTELKPDQLGAALARMKEVVG